MHGPAFPRHPLTGGCPKRAPEPGAPTQECRDSTTGHCHEMKCACTWRLGWRPRVGPWLLTAVCAQCQFHLQAEGRLAQLPPGVNFAHAQHARGHCRAPPQCASAHSQWPLASSTEHTHKNVPPKKGRGKGRSNAKCKGSYSSWNGGSGWNDWGGYDDYYSYGSSGKGKGQY